MVLADDDQITRQSLQALLEAEPDFKIVGVATDGFEAVQAVERHYPDVLVLDFMGRGTNGIEVTRHVTRRSPRTSVVILSLYGHEKYVLEALRAGAKAYVLKDLSSTELVRAIRMVVNGRRYLAAPLSERAIEVYTQSSVASAPGPYDTLTPRERQVLHLVLKGSNNREVAQLLSISRRTVEIHRANLMRKLNVHSQVELIRYALQRDMRPLETGLPDLPWSRGAVGASGGLK